MGAGLIGGEGAGPRRWATARVSALVGLSAVGAALGPAAPARADCDPLTVRGAFALSTVVFDGVALEGPTRDGLLISPARFRVSRYLKVSGPRVLRVRVAGDSEQITPRPGETWRIYGRGRPSRVLDTSVCVLSHRLKPRPRPRSCRSGPGGAASSATGPARGAPTASLCHQARRVGVAPSRLCFGRRPTIHAARDRRADGTVYGTPRADVIVGGSTGDLIMGMGGDDRICGGGGADELYGDDGDDMIDGGDGGDSLNGDEPTGSGDDLLVGGRGRDFLEGWGGDDALRARDGETDARISGGSGRDHCTADPVPRVDPAGVDCEAGDARGGTQCSDRADNDSDGHTDHRDDPGCESRADDSESPEPPPQRLCFSALPTLVGTDGPDTLTGTAGDDVIVGLGGDDTIKGMGGIDRICAGSPNGDGNVPGPIELRSAAGDRHRAQSRSPGTSGRIRARARASAAPPYHGYVRDRAGGNDTIDGGPDADSLDGGRGNDTLNARDGYGDDWIEGGPNMDRCTTDPVPSVDPAIVGCEGGRTKCSDRADNDSDGLTDHPADRGCASPTDNSESPDLPSGSRSLAHSALGDPIMGSLDEPRSLGGMPPAL